MASSVIDTLSRLARKLEAELVHNPPSDPEELAKCKVKIQNINNEVQAMRDILQRCGNHIYRTKFISEIFPQVSGESHPTLWRRSSAKNLSKALADLA
jgi:hypothetical protein